MSSDPLILVEKAARLIYFGIVQKPHIKNNLEFKDLLKEYEHDSEFRKIVTSIATGFQLEVLEVNQTGVYLRPWKDSVFSISLTDVNRLTRRETDRYIGLILIGLASYYFPKDMDFQNPPSHPITIYILDEYLREICQKVKQKMKKTDFKSGEENLEKMAVSYLQLQPVDDLKDRSRKTSYALIQKTINFLEKERLFTKYGKDGSYLPTYRFSIAMDSLINNSYLNEFLKISKEIGGFH